MGAAMAVTNAIAPSRAACCRREREYIRSMAVSSPDLKAFLVATPFFGGLSDASLDLLVSMLVERRFDVGATVVAEGEPGRSMFIVHSGELVVSKLGDAGRVIRMAGLEPGDFFGEMTLIEMQNRSATVVAESPTVLYELTARNLYTYYKADIHAYVMVMQNINRELCRRLRRADNRIAELQMLTRVQFACVMWVEKKLRPTKWGAVVELLCEKPEVARVFEQGTVNFKFGHLAGKTSRCHPY